MKAFKIFFAALKSVPPLFAYCFVLCGASLSFASNTDIPQIIERAVIEQIQRDLQTDTIEIELNITGSTLPRVIQKQTLIDNVTLQKKVTNLRGGNLKIRIDFSDGSTEMMLGRYTSYTYAPIALRFLKAGSIIRDGDISIIKTKLRDIRGNVQHNIAGMQTRRNISSGSLIKSSDLTSLTIIHSNDIVNISYSSGGIMLQTSAIALENGGLGDVISVKNQKTGVILNGTVINSTLVEIGK